MIVIGGMVFVVAMSLDSAQCIDAAERLGAGMLVEASVGSRCGHALHLWAFGEPPGMLPPSEDIARGIVALGGGGWQRVTAVLDALSHPCWRDEPAIAEEIVARLQEAPHWHAWRANRR